MLLLLLLLPATTCFSSPRPRFAQDLEHACVPSGDFCIRDNASRMKAPLLRSLIRRSNLCFSFSLLSQHRGIGSVIYRRALSKSHMRTCEAFRGPTTEDGSASGPFRIDIGGMMVEVLGTPGVLEMDVRRAIDSSPFKHWLSNLTGPGGILISNENGGAKCSLKRVLIQGVDMFGHSVGFVKFKAEMVNEATGMKLPGIVFARGGAVGILILLECDGEKYTVLTEQARVPVGRTILELPAGMLDGDSGDFVGTAAREVEEETSIHIKSSDLINLTSFLDESTGRRMFPSPGGSDEEITLLLYRGHTKPEVIKSLQGKQTGLQDHGEFIKVHVIPYNRLWRVTADSKVLAAITLYEMSKKEGILPPPPNAPELSYL